MTAEFWIAVRTIQNDNGKRKIDKQVIGKGFLKHKLRVLLME